MQSTSLIKTTKAHPLFTLLLIMETMGREATQGIIELTSKTLGDSKLITLVLLVTHYRLTLLMLVLGVALLKLVFLRTLILPYQPLDHTPLLRTNLIAMHLLTVLTHTFPRTKIRA